MCPPISFTLPITPTDPNDRLVATFVMDAPTIDKLKKWILRRITERNKVLPCFNVTSVVATLAVYGSVGVKHWMVINGMLD
ncbi:hypothetical protein GIB67_035864 [Kingdonia uniflora]|uniref:Uncharacterized protein n=1 Tax=Kingdonia uniflora TaxID=39325 RepID=A0A7J7L9L4_9MAGN|nr:hypothetical protein GIB67_035864 [Kingdonia uniflora]